MGQSREKGEVGCIRCRKGCGGNQCNHNIGDYLVVGLERNDKAGKEEEQRDVGKNWDGGYD
jgi:hypothetical protein